MGGEPRPPIVDQKVDVEASVMELGVEAMAEVVHGQHGTARRIADGAKYRMAGKSGTAQVVAIAQNAEYDSDALSERNRDHALFVGFAPLENPKIALAVLLENAESGSGAAAPVMRRVFDAWLLDENGELKESP